MHSPVTQDNFGIIADFEFKHSALIFTVFNYKLCI